MRGGAVGIINRVLLAGCLLLQVLDVTSGAKFYAKGKSYNQFAGTVRWPQD